MAKNKKNKLSPEERSVYLQNCRDNALKKNTITVKIRSFCDDYNSKGISYATVQRRLSWDEKQQMKYNGLILEGKCTDTPVRVVDIDKLLESSKDSETKKLYELIKNKYHSKYDSNDGQNRTAASLGFIEGKVGAQLLNGDIVYWSDLTEIEKYHYLETEIVLTIINSATINQIEDFFIITNAYGNVPTLQETWNVRKLTNEYVKGIIDIAEKHPWLDGFLSNSGVKSKKHLGEHVLTNMVNGLSHYGYFNDNVHNKLNEGKRIDTLEYLNKLLTTVGKFFGNMTETDKKSVTLNWFQNGTLFLDDLLKKKAKIYDYNTFWRWFKTSEDKRRKDMTPLEESGKTYYLWSGSVTRPEQNKVKIEAMYNDLIVSIDNGEEVGVNLEIDEKRDFNIHDKLKIYHLTGGKVKKNGAVWNKNGEVVFFNLDTINDRYYVEESLDRCLKENEADHILNHSRGGKTVPENGLFTTRDYNRWKLGRLELTDDELEVELSRLGMTV